MAGNSYIERASYWVPSFPYASLVDPCMVRICRVESITLVNSLMVRVLLILRPASLLWTITIVAAVHVHHILLGFRVVTPRMSSITIDFASHAIIHIMSSGGHHNLLNSDIIQSLHYKVHFGSKHICFLDSVCTTVDHRSTLGWKPSSQLEISHYQ
jgi:hypothetical protein